MDRRREDDHLSLVAGAAKAQRRKLVDAGVTTLAELADVPETRAVRNLQPRILERLRRQAALQRRARVEGIVPYELIPPNPDEPGKGLAALPPPSSLDVFFDIEADPWALDDGLEYLFGWVERGPGGDPVFHAPGRTIGPRRSGCSRRSWTWSSSGASATRTCTSITTAAMSPGR